MTMKFMEPLTSDSFRVIKSKRRTRGSPSRLQRLENATYCERLRNLYGDARHTQDQIVGILNEEFEFKLTINSKPTLKRDASKLQLRKIRANTLRVQELDTEVPSITLPTTSEMSRSVIHNSNEVSSMAQGLSGHLEQPASEPRPSSPGDLDQTIPMDSRLFFSFLGSAASNLTGPSIIPAESFEDEQNHFNDVLWDSYFDFGNIAIADQLPWKSPSY